MRTRPHSLRRPTAALLAITVISGCSALQSGGRPNETATTRPEVMWALVPPALESHALSGVRDGSTLERRAPSKLPAKSELAIKHPRVDEFVGNFETRNRNFFQRAFDRSARYVPLMMKILREEGLPPDLAYLPLIESAYRNQAVSRAGAVGPWQFMRRTARRYGLRMDRYVDERRDPEKSTRAAARYLKDLYGMFGTWPLSLAAYNAGELRVLRVQERPGVNSFWDMMERGYLRRETRDYVPKFLAAVRIARTPERYGFDEPLDAPVEFDLVEVNRSLALHSIAQMAGVSTAEVKELNPALIRGVTPPDRGGYSVRIPQNTGWRFARAYANAPRYASAAPIPAGEVAYRVRKGDTPASIAKRFGVSVRALMRVNGWKNPRRLMPGQPVRLPEPSRRAGFPVAAADSKDVRLAAQRVTSGKALD